MAVPQERNQRKYRQRRKMRTFNSPTVHSRRLLGDSSVSSPGYKASEDFKELYEALNEPDSASEYRRPGDSLEDMLLNRPRLEDICSKQPMSFLDKPGSFLDPAETTDPDGEDLSDFYEDCEDFD